jgi:hypothetical protein
VRRRTLEGRIGRLCLNALQHTPEQRSKVMAEAKSGLRLLLQQWWRLCEDWNHADAVDWDENVLDAVVAKPETYASVLGTVWAMSKAPKQTALL